MKTAIVYNWEENDPSREFVVNAVFALHSLVSATDDQRHLAEDYRRVIQDNEFTEQNIRGLAELLVKLADRAKAQHEDPASKQLPWRELLLKHSLEAREASEKLSALFYERAPNIKRLDQAAPAGTLAPGA